MTERPVAKRASIVAIFREFATSYPRHFALLFLTLVVEGLVAMVVVLSIVPLADLLLDPTLASPSRVTVVASDILTALRIRPGFWAFGLLFAGSNLIKAALDVVTRYTIMRIKFAVVRGLFGDALRTFFRARWEFFSSVDQGRLLNTLTKELNQIGETLGQVATQLARLVQVSIYLTVPLWLDARMTLTAIGLSLLLGSPLLLLWKTSYRLGQKSTATSNVMIGVLNEILAAARLILGFGRQEQSRGRFMHAFDQYVGAHLRFQSLELGTAAFFTPVGILAVVIALGMALNAGSEVSEMAALLWSLLKLLPLVGALMSTHVSISGFLPSYEQLVALRTEAARVREIEGAREFHALQDSVELRNLSFAYPGRDGTLADIDLIIRKGQMTALVGESGSGKSTITDLVLGLQIPERGEVLLDGVPLGEWRQNSFRERVGYVPQDPLLFNASVRENLLWSLPGASEADLWTACRMANAHGFVEQLPEKLDTVVGDRGVRLSGGQRQRIALARALLRKPELLILDEATSALDSESERLIQRSINDLARDTTVLIIAHRLSTIARADQVYVLSRGRIVEEGAYRDLSSKPGGILAQMIEIQALEPIVTDSRRPTLSSVGD